MKSDRFFLRLASLTLIFLYLVILAGSVVRATGSGMGCPDWPKCFGYYIPPTDPAQVEFHSNHAYEKSMMIIVNDTLWRAKTDFTSGNSFDQTNWEKYPVHNYAKFFVQQTWTEYINRLMGALSGLATFCLLILSVFRWKKDKRTVFLLLLGMFVLGFVGWLGKVVVDTNLKPLSISMHMLSAMAMVAIVIVVQSRTRRLAGEERHGVSKWVRYLLFFALALTLDQVIFGTQVRQEIDAINHNMEGHSRETWIEQLGGVYDYHKLMAVIVLLTNLVLFYLVCKSKPKGTTQILAFSLILLMLAEYGAGVFMHNFAIPAFVQPVHLVLAMILFGIQFALLMRVRKL